MSTEIVVREGGEVMSREKIELIKQTVAKGATDLELDLFLHACKRTGLDPLMKQIYAIKRKNGKTGQMEMAIQTGIDGYRLIADRTGRYAGSDEPAYTVGQDGFPDVASVTIFKMIDGQRCGFSASARWAEYYQDASPMWKKMPFLMLGKCAEALALRKAFPAELSGVYTHEEMMQADNEPRNPILEHKQTAQAKINELRNEGLKPEPQAAGTAHQGTGEKGPSTDGLGTPPQASDRAPAPSEDSPAFIWRVGKKHAGESVRTIPDDYLAWFAENGKAGDHVQAANDEIDRRMGQSSADYADGEAVA